MAEALTRHHWGHLCQAFSAGTYPLGYITPNTLLVLRERNIATDGLFSKGFDQIDFSKLSLIVSLTRENLESFIPRSLSRSVIRCHVHDPFGEGLNSFREVRNTIEWVVTEKLPQWLNLNHPQSLPAKRASLQSE